MTRADVVVVGAGLSGLTAAWGIARSGKSVIVLEARDRVGGRTLSVSRGASAYDLGGQWIGPGQTRVEALARELSVETFPTYDSGRKLLVLGDEIRSYRGTIPRLPALQLLAMARAYARIELGSRRIRVDGPWDSATARELDAISAEELFGPLPEPARDVMGAAFRTVFGAEPRQISALWALRYVRAGGGFFNLVGVRGGAQERRFVRGAQSLSQALASRLGEAVRLGGPALSVSQSEDSVEVTTAATSVTARFAVIAVPPPLRKKIGFASAIAAQNDSLAAKMPMGATTKVLGFYDEPFWRTRGLSGEAVFAEGPLSVVFDNTTPDGQAALVGFVVGDDARRLAELEVAAQRERLLAQLSRAFGDRARAVVELVLQDWANETWTGGCPVASFTPRAMCGNAPALRAPTGRLHWAGTETASQSPGYLDGAVDAGERAASEIAARW